MIFSRLPAVIAVAALLLFIRLGGTSVFQVAEARNSECAHEMMQSRDEVVPTFNGTLRTDKPALEYYAMIGAYKLFGTSEGSARFFSAVCGVLVVVSTFFFVKKHKGAAAAGWSVFVLLSSLHAVLQFRLATPDPYLILFHTTSLYCFWEGFTEKRFSRYLLMYFLLGLAFFAKGPVGVLIPALTIFLYLLLTKNLTRQNILRLQPWTGLLLIGMVGLPWYYLVHVHTHGEWTKDFFLQHNIGRFNQPVDDHGGPFVLTFLFPILGMFPFSLFFVRAGKHAWQKRAEDQLPVFCLVAFCSVVMFYLFSATRLLNYTTPAYPFLAVLLGVWISEKAPQASFRQWRPELSLIWVVGLLLPAGVYAWASRTEPISQASWIAYPLLCLPVAGLVAFSIAKRDLANALLITGYAYMLVSVLVFAWLFPKVDDLSALKKEAPLIRNANDVVAYKTMNDAFVFYAKDKVRVFENKDSLANYIALHQRAVVLYDGRDAADLGNVPALELYSKDRDLFSSKYSFIYRVSSKKR